MTLLENGFRIGCLALLLGVPAVRAEPVREETGTGLWDRIVDTVSEVARDGQYDAYLSGYAYHSRKTYSAKKISGMNELAWGGGIGKTLRNERGNDESLFLSALKDSRSNIQWSAGYTYQWSFPLAEDGIEAGAGVTAAVIRRHDWYDGIPFPAILPMASIGSRSVKLNAVYMPRISVKKGKGDVVLLYLKLTF